MDRKYTFKYMVHVSYKDTLRGNCIDEFIAKVRACDKKQAMIIIDNYVNVNYGNSYTGKVINELSDFPVIAMN